MNLVFIVNKICKKCGKKFVGYKRRVWCDDCRMFICRICGKKVVRMPCSFRRSQNVYCSTRCQFVGMKNGRTLKCDYCGKKFYLCSSYFSSNKLQKDDKKHFCSKKCWYSFFRENNGYVRKRKSRPRKKRVKNLYHSIRQSLLFRNWRNDVFRRDGYRCKVCGYKGYLYPHHIVTFKSLVKKFKIKIISDAYCCKKLWDVGNGITLCKRCHVKTYRNEKLFEDVFRKLVCG